MTIHRIRGAVSVALVLVASGIATVPPASAKVAPRRHPAPRRHKHPTGIPQHNGGDHDADNNGGPSDGDGNI